MAGNVRIIPATRQRYTSAPIGTQAKRRTAGYARVSTDKEEQLTSYEAQVDYYTKFINQRSDWEFITVYTDEGISATSTKKRDGFNQMVQDALDGKLDLIVTKSVSRFARNTVDSLQTVRALKEKGVEIYFEEQNIWTLDSKGELLITIMSSLAQEESRSISENTTWGQRKRFADGKISLPYSHFLGYEKGDDGLPKIIPEEAETVKLIYRLFLEGKTAHGIAKILTDEEIPSPAGKARWLSGTVLSILQNEKYEGHALLQKKYTVDFLTKKQKVNEGEVPQYFVENSHPAIIEPAVFEMVQAEIKRRNAQKGKHSGIGFFASRIICGDCGGFYGSKVWHSTNKYRRTVWQCNAKWVKKSPVDSSSQTRLSGSMNGDKCTTPHLYETDIQKRFVAAANQLLCTKNNLAADFEEIKTVLFCSSALEAECKELQNEMAIVAEMIEKCVDDNAHRKQNQDEYNQRYNGLVARFDKAKIRHNEAAEQIQERKVKRMEAERFLSVTLKKKEPLTDFDEQFWYATVETVTVYQDGRMVFKFKDGTEIEG